MRIIVYIFSLFICFNAVAQSSNQISTILSFDKFIEVVKAQHPIAKQAELILGKAKADVRTARGAFDPKAFYSFSNKSFDSKEYYDLNKLGLKVPTWYGVEFNAGYEQNDGVFLNPEHSTPAAGLWQAGVSANLGKGLFIDKRRATLKKAQLMQKSSVEENKIIFNELIYDAGNSYWDWFNSYNNFLIYQEAVQLAQERLDGVKLAVKNGDKPAIDTVEATIQFQNRQLNLQQAELDYKNNSLLLSTFLWQDGTIPLEINSTTTPEISLNVLSESDNGEFQILIDSLPITHPYLKILDLKIQQLEVTKRLKSEMLKPNINLRYNALNQPIGNDPFAEFNENNYKWGVELSMPLLLRKERGELRKAQLEIRDYEYELESKKLSYLVKAKTGLNYLSTTFDQTNLYASTVTNYENLLKGERKKFAAGESSLFMVNSREIGYIKAQIKYNELLSKNKKALITLSYYLMSLYDNQ